MTNNFVPMCKNVMLKDPDMWKRKRVCNYRLVMVKYLTISQKV